MIHDISLKKNYYTLNSIIESECENSDFEDNEKSENSKSSFKLCSGRFIYN